MDKFVLKSKFKPTGDQPEAIAALTEGVLAGERMQTLMGVTGSGKTFNINFQNVKFVATDLAMAKNLISQSTVSSVKNLTVNFTFDECDFKIEKEKLSAIFRSVKMDVSSRERQFSLKN